MQRVTPFTASLSAPILAMSPLKEGVAVLTNTGVELLSDDLKPLASIPGALERVDRLAALEDGRFLAFAGGGFTRVYAGRRGEAMKPVYEGEGFSDRPFWREGGGFVANYDGRLYVDEAGRGQWVSHGFAGTCEHATKERLLIHGEAGLGLLDWKGKLVASREGDPYPKVLAVLDKHIAIVANDKVLLLDGSTLAEIGKLKVDAESATAIGDALLFKTDDGVSCWDLATRRERFRIPSPTKLGVVTAVGDRIVLGAREPHRAIVAEQDGQIVDEIALQGAMRLALPFGGGVAVLDRGPDVLFWKGKGDVVRLAHDVYPANATLLGDSLGTSEGRHLYRFRLGASGPEPAPLQSSIPLGVPIVSRGQRLRATRVGRFHVIADGVDHTKAIDADAPWRLAVAAPEAKRILDRLIARDLTGEIAPVDPGGSVMDAAAALEALPPERTAALHARGLFGGSSLDERTRRVVEQARGAFIEELAAALETRPRVLLAAIRAGRFPLVPPRELVHYDYVGAFETTGELWVADPAQFIKRGATGKKWRSIKLDAQPGPWHVFLRNGVESTTRTAELVAAHDEGFDSLATQSVGKIGVDSGLAGIYDRRCKSRSADSPIEEGLLGERGAIATSGFGDGVYDVHAAKKDGRAVKLRIAFLEEASPDRTKPAAAKGGRRYAANVHFAVGETLEHSKFGSGVVTSVTLDGKIVVAFDDGTRTLVHKPTA